MKLEQNLDIAQKLVMTHAMQQSLQFLQLPAVELRETILEEALANPLLEVNDDLSELAPQELVKEDLSDELDFKFGETSLWKTASSEHDTPLEVQGHAESFPDFLNEQLGQMAELDSAMLACCRYLVGCLSASGYMECSLADLAEEMHQSLFEVQQALFVVQSLDPAGVGARNLTECLLLQLERTSYFSAATVRTVSAGLPLLANRDMKGLAKLLDVSPAEAEHTAAIICSLNPIPSRGFHSGSAVAYVMPEATIQVNQNEVSINLNQYVLPQVSISREYSSYIGADSAKDAQKYLKEKLAEARSIIAGIENRGSTLSQLLTVLVECQKPYFLQGQSLQPMTMQDIADQMQVNVSTISRAVKDKYIQYQGKVIPLRKFFTSSIMTSDGSAVSSDNVKQRILQFIQSEQPENPLSDDLLCQALASVNISLSRRTVTKYRGELGIPSAHMRKKGAP